MSLEQAMAKIAELEAKIEEMKKGEMELADALKKKDEAMCQEKKLFEQKETFAKMLSEGKAVEAQREAFMGGDMVKFAELAQPVNAKPAGQDGAPVVEKKDERPAHEQIFSLAEKLVKENKISFADAQSRVLHENPELRALYEKESTV